MYREDRDSGSPEAPLSCGLDTTNAGLAKEAEEVLPKPLTMC